MKPDGETGISVSEKGIAYKLKDAPFEFQYSYTETPKVKPLALREAAFLPFGPTTMPRPWTGRAPLPPSKKMRPEFDSFRLPPPNKKGVKSVQAPGPFLAGAGPKYTAATREEILGEPLTNEEIKELVNGSLKSQRQLNIGRDGLTHNMLDNIHAHWKRRRVCKIKCKGVCTVDMDNVREQLEEKTGGKVIYGRGGVIYLYRGRNYNYRTRPRYPLMLWKPMTPIYPRLVQRAPEGLTLEEATEMRKKGRQLPPICKLGKNGLYSNLIKNVKEAFEECELVRINCKDMNKSDYRKIGAKLRDLVPCVLVSFEYEHILMWRGKEWKSSLPPSDGLHEAMGITADAAADEETLKSENLNLFKDFGREDATDNLESCTAINKDLPVSDSDGSSDDQPHNEGPEQNSSKFERLDHEEDMKMLYSQSNSIASSSLSVDSAAGNWGQDMLAEERCNGSAANTDVPWLEGVKLFIERAVEAGSAVVLDEESLDADIVLAESVALARKAQSGPTFQHRSKKPVSQKIGKGKSDESEEEDAETLAVSRRKGGEKKSHSMRKEELFLDAVPYGSLGVDELAKLLA